MFFSSALMEIICGKCLVQIRHQLIHERFELFQLSFEFGHTGFEFAYVFTGRLAAIAAFIELGNRTE